MAIYYARKSGNVNAADVWATTPSGTASDVFSTFTNQDTLVSNNFTVTLNVNTTVLEIRNDTTGGATAGGGFTLNSGIILNSNIYAGSVTCVTYSASTGSSTINGNVFGGSGSNSAGVAVTNNGTLNIIGNVTGGSGTVGSGLTVTTGVSSTVNIIGIVNSGSSYGITAYATCTLNITGSVITNSGTTSIWNGAGNATINIIGNVTAILIPAIQNQTSSGGTINVTGNIYGGQSTTAIGISNTNIGIINITGSVIGGISAAGISNNSIGSVTVIGTATGGAGASGISNSSTGTITATRAKGNNFGPGSVGITSQVGISNSQTGTAKVYEIEYGSLGQSPTSGPIELVTANSNVAVFATRLGNPKTLVDLNNATNLVPSSGNVRSGVSYNYGNNTGSCVIPHPNSVVYGVPVDNTIGSGLLSPVAIWNALTSSIGTSGSIGERLKNVSTVATVGKQFEGVL